MKTNLRLMSCRARVSAVLFMTVILLTGFRVSALADEAGPADSATTADSAKTSVSSAYLMHTNAASGANDALAGYMSHESMFPSFLKITLALIAVIIGIYLTLALLKKAMGRKVSGGARGNALEVIETCYLAPKRSVTLVRVGKRAALLSVADSTIATLLELDADETREIVEATGSQSAGPDFRHSLQRAKQKIVDLGSYAMKGNVSNRLQAK